MYQDENTIVGTADELTQLRRENDQLRQQLSKKSNTRLKFRTQVLRELVTPPFKENQQHLAKRLAEGPINEATDTWAETIFQRLGEAVRGIADNGERLNELNAVMQSVQERADSTEKFMWCKGCGEDMADCHCSIPKPRQG